MKVFHDILNLFFEAYQVTGKFENQHRVELTVKSTDIKLPSESDVSRFSAAVEGSDTLTLDVTIGDNEPISIYTQTIGSNNFVQALTEGITHKDLEDGIEIKITVHKSFIERKLNIYDSETFTSYL